MQTVTFYSYKGGVGRSLALANFGRYLARLGQTVVALDFDLEAPGLTYKFFPDGVPDGVKAGLVDKIIGFKDTGDYPVSVQDIALQVPLQRNALGKLWLLPAGRAPEAPYWRAHSRIDWHKLIYDPETGGLAFFLEFKELIREELKPDFLLIDARTGVTDPAAVASAVFADTVVALLLPTPEHMDGVRAMLRGLAGAPRPPGMEALKLIPVISRVPGETAEADVQSMADRVVYFLNEASAEWPPLNIAEALALHIDPALQMSERAYFAGGDLEKSPLVPDYLRLFSRLAPVESLREALDPLVRYFGQLATSSDADVAFARNEVANALLQKAWELRFKGESRQAANLLAEIIGRADAPEVEGIRAHATVELAVLDAMFGEPDKALVALEEAVEIFDRLGDVRSKAVTLGNIADILEARGQLDQALKIRTEEEIPVYDRLGDVRSKAVTMGQIAGILQARGQLDQALKIRTEEEIPVYDRLGDVQSKAVTMGKIADILVVRGQLDQALKIRTEEEIPVYDRLGDVRSKAVTMGQIAGILQARGQLDQALKIRTEEEIPVYDRLGDVRSKAITMGQIAGILEARGQLDQALSIKLTEELSVYERLGDLENVAVTHWEIARIKRQMLADGRDWTQDGEIADHLTQAHEMICRVGRLDAACVVGLDYGAVLAARGEVAEARAVLTRSRDGFRQLGRNEEEQRAEALLAALPLGAY